MPAERLQKIIAAAGVASRRKAEELIAGGLVSVNGKIVTELGSKADPAHDHIKVNGKLLSGPERPVYVLLHKPKGYVTTVTDPEGRPTVLDLVRGLGSRVYPVGRLDYLSEGLLLLTNDGELAQKLTHAASHVPKTYLVKISGKADEQQLDKLRGGIRLPAERTRLKTPEGAIPKGESRRRSEAVLTAPSRIKLIKEGANPWYEVMLIEGRNRQIRRMFEEIGHHVEKIRRVQYGPLSLDVEPGKFRHLTAKEVGQLKIAARGRKRADSA
jgi:23S rRNA pseudouridine2605 synthase